MSDQPDQPFYAPDLTEKPLNVGCCRSVRLNRVFLLNWRLLCVLMAVSVMFACTGGGSTSPSTAPKSFCAPPSSTLPATTLTFDDLVFTPNATNNPSVNNVPNGYGGLNWTSFQFFHPVSCAVAPSQSGCPANFGLQNGLISSPNDVFSVGGAGNISSSTPFDVVSGYFTGVWRDGVQVTVTGVNGPANTTCTVTFSVNTTGPTFEVLNVNDVTTVTLSGSGGTLAPNVLPVDNNPDFVLDNLTIR